MTSPAQQGIPARLLDPMYFSRYRHTDLHQDARMFLGHLALALGLPADQVRIVSRPSPEPWGAIVLRTEHLCVELYEGLASKGVNVCYHSGDGGRRPRGIRHWVSMPELTNPGLWQAFLANCRRLAAEAPSHSPVSPTTAHPLL